MHGWCVPLTARCSHCDRELHHSYFIYYGHDTQQNCVIHTNPHTNMKDAHGLVNIEILMNYLLFKKACVQKKKRPPEMPGKPGGQMNDGEERELVKGEKR